nr:hypothetical protein [Bacteroidota bacterium]
MEEGEKFVALIIATVLFSLTIIGFSILIYKILEMYVQFVAFNIFRSNPFRYLDIRPKRLEPFQEKLLMQHFEYYRGMPEK